MSQQALWHESPLICELYCTSVNLGPSMWKLDRRLRKLMPRSELPPSDWETDAATSVTWIGPISRAGKVTGAPSTVPLAVS